jgi:hypothetical protein
MRENFAIREFGKFVACGCGMAVGKVVKREGQVGGLYPLYTATVPSAAQKQASYPSLLAAYEQLCSSFTQAFSAYTTDGFNNLYPLSTGPTNTTKLNKGLNL